MAAMQSSFGDLSLALAQAITYLTRSLIARYPATTIIKLQLALENNLKAILTLLSFGHCLIKFSQAYNGHLSFHT